MANELEQIPNPTNIPEGITTGYQRQNVLIAINNTGIDTTEPVDNNNGIITVPAGGVIDVNGVIYKIVKNITINKPNANTIYWLAVDTNNEGKASLSLVTRPGTWHNGKKGFYRSDGRRTLNWCSLGNPDNINVSNISPFLTLTNKGKYEIQVPCGWLYIVLTSGLGNGTGGDGANGNDGRSLGNGSSPVGGTGGAGGVVSIYNIKRAIFFNNYVITNENRTRNRLFNIGIGGNGSNGSNGSNGGNGGQHSGGGGWGGSGGGGGGGGGGAGQESFFENIRVDGVTGGAGGTGGRGGKGGDGMSGNGSNGSSSSTAELPANPYNETWIISSKQISIPINSGSRGSNGGDGGKGGAGNSDGSGGGNGGLGGVGGNAGTNGINMPDGSPGGYCSIYLLGD